LGASSWVDGVPLVTIDTETGEMTDLGLTMLLTSEAYAWRPTHPGVLALAAGSGRLINANKHLAVIDVHSGDLTYLTAEDEAAFAPAWAPDGTWLAFAVMPSTQQAEGDGEALERTLLGRAITLVNPETGERHTLTQPGEAIDGWPRWTADGRHLLYTRQQAGQTEVRVVALDGSSDALLLTGLSDPTCVYGGCGWSRMLAYTPATTMLQTATQFAVSRAALADYDPPQGAQAVMDNLSRVCAAWLSGGHAPEDLRDTLSFITYTLQGGSGWTELLYVYRWIGEADPAIVFHAALVNWAGWIRFRRAQTLAYLDRPEAARPEMQTVAAAYPDDPPGELVAAFLVGYGDRSDESAAAQGYTALKVRDHIQNERGGTPRYPMTTEGVLCCEPGTSEAGHPDGRWPRVGGADNRWVDIDPQ
jgi:hypothetical protein